MNFSLDQLLSFVEAAKHGSFSAAARSIGKAQSRVSEAISNLEVELGVRLFDRSTKYPTLTKEGERLLKDAEEIIISSKEFYNLALKIEDDEELRLRIAVDELISLEQLTEILKRFEEVFPKMELELLFGTLNDITEMVESERVDLGLDVPLRDISNDSEWKYAGEISFTTVVSSKHPLAKIKKVTKKDLSKHRQLVIAAKSGERDFMVFGKDIWMMETSQAILSSVNKGLGWATLSKDIVEHEIKKGTLTQLKLDFVPQSMSAKVFVTWKKGNVLGAGASWFAEEFLKLFK